MTTVAHIDHTSESGGAELALARLIHGRPRWVPHIFIPPREDSQPSAFAGIPHEFISTVGVSQPAGAIGSSLAGQLSLLTRSVYQGIALRFDRNYRDSEIAHANTSRAALIGWVSCVGSRRPLVVHLRDAIDADAIGPRNARLLKFIIGRANGVIANSKYTLATAAPYISSDALAQVIPSSIGLTTRRYPVKTRTTVRTIGMLSRITEWKGQELLIRAFAHHFKGLSIELQLAGAPAFGQQSHLLHLEKLSQELGVGAQVRFLGHIDDIWPLLDSWDVCVHASLHSEPLGQNVLQYLAACRPTIAANSGGPTEWVDHESTGLLFEPGSKFELGNALRRLVEDKELRGRFSSALAAAQPVPTDSAIMRMYENFFESLRKDWGVPQTI